MQVLEFNPKEFDDSKITIDGRVDAAFRKINRNTIGFHIWKVDNDRVEAINKTKLGVFHDDSTYIIYAACVKGTYVNQDTISRDVKPPTPQIERFIHFWLGEKTSPEKSGVVAYKVIEFDIHLGCTTTQYREVQGYESSRFLSYFKQGLTILCGDYQTASPKPEIRLFQVIGRKSSRCIQKSTIEWTHFNSAHVMLFQTNLYLYVWIGRSSSSSERLHGLLTAIKFRDAATEHGEKSEITIVDDGYEQSMKEARKTEWNNFLSLTQRFVQPALYNPQHKNHQTIPCKLYKCGHLNGKYRIEEIKTMLIEQSDLSDSEAAYIIDGEERGVWIWIGKNINTQEKAEAMRNARGFVKKKKYSATTPVVRVVENHEPEEFMRLFPAWVDNHQDLANINNNKVSSILGKFDSLTLMQRPKLAAQTQLIDDGCGDLKIFRVDGNKLIELPKIANGSLFSGDVYIVIYEVILPDNIKDLMIKLKHVIYLWMGKSSTANDKLNGCNLATEVCDRLGKSTLQVRLNEGFESAHFLQIFKGNLIVFNGQSTDYDPSGMNTREPNSYVLKIFGNSTYTSKAVQVNSKTVYTANDCFVLKTSGDEIWVWCGQCSTGDSREIAKSIGTSLGEYTLVIESNEPEEFWSALTDKTAINFRRVRSNQIIATNQKPIITQVANNNIKPALFIGYLENGNIATSQLIGFEQKDLSSDDIYLLDSGTMIYIWFGNTCATNEKQFGWQMASHLLTNASIQREIRLPIALARQGYEPPTFMGFFDAWDIKLWNEHQTFDTLRNQIEPAPASILKNGGTNGHTNGITNGGKSHTMKMERNLEFDQHQKYPFELLKAEAECLPEGIDPKRKEIHLTHDDFVSIFKMPFSEFETLPSWRKQELKKKNKLF